MHNAITDEDVNEIVDMIRQWPKLEPFKWDFICKGSKSILGYEPTRQALNKKLAVKRAYAVKKEQLRFEANKLSRVARPRSTLEAMERLVKLQEENDQLKGELNKMAEIANRFIYNAKIKGLTPEQLMRPMPQKKKP